MGLPSQHLVQRCRPVLLDPCRSDRLCWMDSCVEANVLGTWGLLCWQCLDCWLWLEHSCTMCCVRCKRRRHASATLVLQRVRIRRAMHLI